MDRVFKYIHVTVFLILLCGVNSQYVRRANEKRFWIVTDVHFDHAYSVGSEVECGEPLCCHETNSTNVKVPAGKWGNLKCDPPLILVEGVFEQMRKIEPNPDYIIWLGDNVPHNVWAQSRQNNIDATANCTRFIKEAFPNVPVFPVIGNHEAYPSDQIAPPPQMSWLYSALAEEWSEWFSDEALASFLYGGFYATTTHDGLLIVALNLMYCDPLNVYAHDNGTDPADQLGWLKSTLTNAELIGQKVMIISHIPPGMAAIAGVPNCMPEYSNQFEQIINQFSDIIIGQLFGHTHTDSFLVFRNDSSSESLKSLEPTSFAVVTPSLTPFQGHNPAARMITYSSKSKKFENIFTYWVDLNATNDRDEIVWDLEYQLPEDYKMKDLSPKSWLDLSERLEVDFGLWDLWHAHMYTMADDSTCDLVCKRLAICAAQHVGNVTNYANCVKVL